MKRNMDQHRVLRRKRPVLLRDEERYRLLYGPYEPPLVKGGFLVDAVRGKVRFGTFTNALIPWPKSKRQGKHGSGGSIVLCGDLLWALKKESIPAISHHWGVSRATVGNWRRALELSTRAKRTPGAQRLVDLAVELAKLPESRKKISEAARGRVLSPARKARLFAGIRKGWRERFLARRAAYRRTGRFPKATKSDPWIPEEEKLLPKLTTAELVQVLGRTFQSIQTRRLFLNIRARPPANQQPWRDWEIKRLGTGTDRAIAKCLGRSESSVEGKRRKLGIESASRHFWTSKEEAIIGKVPDAEAARRLGRTPKAVQHRRHKLGMSFFRVENQRKWTVAEEALLGTETDLVIAKRLGRTVRSVAIHRRQKGIAPQYSRFRPWTEREIALLGTMTDVEAARKLNRGVFSVRCKRGSAAIPPGTNRRWNRSEDKLLGKMPDEEAAQKLGRTVAAVRMRRVNLHIPIFQSRHRAWEKWELSLLGTRPDGEVAKRIGRTLSAVQTKRYELQIPGCQPATSGR
ncbi:MAG: hypothetical protein L0Y58_25560 [Verrucomicrobia subdivision 3 bacterium]|nr:hypothetical protein [Limisphaerales bacterium]